MTPPFISIGIIIESVHFQFNFTSRVFWPVDPNCLSRLPSTISNPPVQIEANANATLPASRVNLLYFVRIAKVRVCKVTVALFPSKSTFPPLRQKRASHALFISMNPNPLSHEKNDYTIAYRTPLKKKCVKRVCREPLGSLTQPSPSRVLASPYDPYSASGGISG